MRIFVFSGLLFLGLLGLGSWNKDKRLNFSVEGFCRTAFVREKAVASEESFCVRIVEAAKVLSPVQAEPIIIFKLPLHKYAQLVFVQLISQGFTEWIRVRSALNLNSARSDWSGNRKRSALIGLGFKRPTFGLHRPLPRDSDDCARKEVLSHNMPVVLKIHENGSPFASYGWQQFHYHAVGASERYICALTRDKSLLALFISNPHRAQYEKVDYDVSDEAPERGSLYTIFFHLKIVSMVLALLLG